MKVVSSEIDAYYDITVRFRIENIRDYMDWQDGSPRLPGRRQSEKFGRGWYFEWHTVFEDGEASLGFYFRAGHRGYPEPITWTVVAKSLNGDKIYFEGTVTDHSFTSAANGFGWSTFISKSRLDRSTTLQEEDVLCITATIKARVVLSPSFDEYLDVSHGLVTTGDRPCDVSFVAESIRGPSGQLSSPRKTFADKKYIRKMCPRLGKHLGRSDAARGVVPVLFGEGGRRPGRAVPGTTVRDRMEEMEDDVDSDFEVEEETPIFSPVPMPEIEVNRGRGSNDKIALPQQLVDSECSPLKTSEDDPADSPIVDDQIVLFWGTETSTHVAAQVESSVPAQNPGVNVSDRDTPQEGATSPTEDLEWVLEDMTVTGGEVVPDTLSADKHARSKLSPPTLLWSSSDGVLDMDAAMVSSIHTRADEDSKSGTQDVACQTDPSYCTPVLEPTPLPWTSPPPPNRIVPAVEVAAASNTWEAFLFYLYTGAITFAPLRSRGEDARKDFIATYKAKNPHRPAPCSCKSIYRIASILDMQDLQMLALKELGSQLSKDNIVMEVFTYFTSQHDDVRELEVRILKEHWAELKGTVQMSDMLKKVVRCNMAHATAIMGALW